MRKTDPRRPLRDAKRTDALSFFVTFVTFVDASQGGLPAPIF